MRGRHGWDKKYISSNWLWIAAGVAVKLAYIERGYAAYGGEWLTSTLVLLGIEAIGNIGDTVKELFGEADD